MMIWIGAGGSSAVNFYTWSKPPAADVNAWEELGNPGWDWKAYTRYTMRAEEYVARLLPSIRLRVLHGHR